MSETALSLESMLYQSTVVVELTTGLSIISLLPPDVTITAVLLAVKLAPDIVATYLPTPGLVGLVHVIVPPVVFCSTVATGAAVPACVTNAVYTV